MGDRTTTYYPHGCGGEVEEYDAPSSLLFVASCNKCGWNDYREYYETGEHTIELLTKEQAEAKGFCTNCGYHMEALAKSIDYKKYFSLIPYSSER